MLCNSLKIVLCFPFFFTYGLGASFKRLWLWEYKKEEEKKQKWNFKLTFCIQCFKYLWRQHKEKEPTKKWRKHFNVETSFGPEEWVFLNELVTEYLYTCKVIVTYHKTTRNLTFSCFRWQWVKVFSSQWQHWIKHSIKTSNVGGQ